MKPPENPFVIEATDQSHPKEIIGVARGQIADSFGKNASLPDQFQFTHEETTYTVPYSALKHLLDDPIYRLLLKLRHAAPEGKKNITISFD